MGFELRATDCIGTLDDIARWTYTLLALVFLRPKTTQSFHSGVKIVARFLTLLHLPQKPWKSSAIMKLHLTPINKSLFSVNRTMMHWTREPENRS